MKKKHLQNRVTLAFFIFLDVYDLYGFSHFGLSCHEYAQQ